VCSFFVTRKLGVEIRARAEVGVKISVPACPSRIQP